MPTDVILDLQIATETSVDFSEQLFVEWIRTTLQHANTIADEIELTIRIVGIEEMTELNQQYRKKSGPTNVLSFPFENPPGMKLPLIGDIIICVDILEAEAKQQHKPLVGHWAHLVVHGCLHLLGHDHIEEKQAQEMEELEIAILQQLNFPNPYEVLHSYE